MNVVSGNAMLLVVLVILLRGVMTRTDVYGAFLAGAKQGMDSAFSVLLTRLAAPLLRVADLPEEIAPMLLLRPLTGSGSIAALEQIFRQCGVDSRAGRIASVLMGSSETIFYTMTVYLGAAGVRRLPYVLGTSLCAYFLSAAICGLLM